MAKIARALPQAGREHGAQRRSGRGGLRAALLPLVSLPLLLFFALPLLALILRVLAPNAFVAHPDEGLLPLIAHALPGSAADFLSTLRTPEVGEAIGLSARTTALTTAIALLAGTPVAYLLARRRFRGRAIVETLIDLPMTLPPAVAGIALLFAFGRRGLFGHALSDAGIEVAFTQAAVVMAQTFVAAPFYVKAAVAAFAGVERELEQAAALDGASPLQGFRAVTLPLAAPALFGGAVMTWARALGEFGATIIFAGNFPGRTQTMPLAIYLGFEIDLRSAVTLAAILLLVSFAVLLIVKGLLRQQIDIRI